MSGPSGPKLPAEALLLGLALFLVVAATNILTPLLPVIRDDFGVSIATAGWVVGSFGLARLILDLPAGVLIDRVGHRPLSVFALVVLVVSSGVGLVAPTLEVLILARIGSGLAVSILATVILAALASIAGPANRGRVMGIFPTANNVSSAFYPLAGGVIGEIFDWRATFALTAALAVVGGLMLVPLLLRVDLTPRAGGARPAQADPRILHGRPRVVAIGAITLGVVATLVHRHGFRSTVLPLYAATALGLGGISIATAIALMSITAIAVSIPGGILSDRIGRRRVIMAGITVFAVGDLGFLLTNDLLSFVVVAAVVGLGDFFPSSQTALLSEIVPPEQRTRVLSGYRFAVDLGAFIGPILLAAVMDVASAQAAIVLTAVILVAAVLAARFGVPAGVDRRAAAHGAPSA